MTNLRWLCIAASLAFLLAFPIQAQIIPQEIGVWRYDSNFYIGAHSVPDVATAMDSLHMSFRQNYFEGIKDIRKIIDMDTTPSNPLYGTFVFKADSLRKIMYDLSYRRGFGHVFAPDYLYFLVLNTLAVDNYWDAHPDLQNYTFASRYASSDTSNIINYKNQGFFKGIRVPGNGGQDTVMIAGNPRYTYWALEQSEPFYYDTVMHITYDEFGVKRDTVVRDSLRQLYDKSKFFYVGFAIRADNIPPLMDSSTALAYADLFVRDTHKKSGTPDTAFPIYKRIGRFNITRRMYSYARDPNHPNYSPVGDNFFEVDTLLDLSQFIPIPNPNHFGVGGWLWNPGSVAYPKPTERTLYEERGRAWVAYRHDSLSTSDSLYLPDSSYFFGTDPVAESEFVYKFYTTRKVDISFLRGRISQHSYGWLKRDSLNVIIAASVNPVYNDTLIDSVMMRIGIADEVHHQRSAGYAGVSARVQNIMATHQDRRGIWMNPAKDFANTRVSTGDFDSVRVNNQLNKKMVHMAARQSYGIGVGFPMPITYANPDSLGRWAADSVFRILPDYTVVDSTGTDTVFNHWVIGNNIAKYDTFTVFWQKTIGHFNPAWQDTSLFYSLYDPRYDPDTNRYGGMMGHIAYFADVHRFKYLNISPYSAPTWNVVQVHGYVKQDPTTPYIKTFFGIRTPTPEEIVLQTWLSMGAGYTGIVYSDFQDDGNVTGVIGAFTLDHSQEYGRMREGNEFLYQLDTNRRIDSMWLGRASRFAALKEVTGELHMIDTLVGWKNLQYKQEQMSVHDTVRRSFDRLPMVDSVRAVRAKRYARGTGGIFVDSVSSGSTSLDPPVKTYLEVTHFTPGMGDSLGYRSHARYILITNRRLFPVDITTYVNTSRFGTLFPCAAKGLGAIDVRKPRLTFKNSTEVVADKLSLRRSVILNGCTTTIQLTLTSRLIWIGCCRGVVRSTALPRIVHLSIITASVSTAEYDLKILQRIQIPLMHSS